MHDGAMSFFAPNKSQYDTKGFTDENAGIAITQYTELRNLVEALPMGDAYKAPWVKAQLYKVYRIRTRDGRHFAKIKVTAIGTNWISFQYVYQPSGSRILER